MKPHGRDCPDRCSICLGAPARKVDQRDDVLWIDDEPVRPLAAPQSDFVRYGRRGGKR